MNQQKLEQRIITDGHQIQLAVRQRELRIPRKIQALFLSGTVLAAAVTAALNYAGHQTPAGPLRISEPASTEIMVKPFHNLLAAPLVPDAQAPSAAAPAAQAPTASQVPALAPAAPAPAAPAPQAVQEPVPAPNPDGNLYTVVAGDTPSAIAARYGVDLSAMLAANGLGASSVIVPGQVLTLSGPPIAQNPVAATVPAPAAPAVAPAPAAVAAVPAPATHTIYIAGSGGQSMVDACIGPIHFTPTDAYSLFITEHDFCGGWARFSGIQVGETVNIAGYGTYAVTARGQVPQGGTTNNVAAVFGGFPRAILQTCIPGTNQMLLIALN